MHNLFRYDLYKITPGEESRLQIEVNNVEAYAKFLKNTLYAIRLNGSRDTFWGITVEFQLKTLTPDEVVSGI
jgi:hypothetical protein